jgi:aerobic carbon-monoxide dehydrogenase small subunit
MSTQPAGTGQATDSYTLSVNGKDHRVTDAWIGESLLYVLRERLGLPGSKNACEQGECGSCSVLLDGVLVASCCVMGADAAGSDVRTVEGLSPSGELTDVQRGFCIPGMIVAMHDLLDRRPDADELALREALSGNLCRCTGYGRIFAAFHAVKEERARART